MPNKIIFHEKDIIEMSQLFEDGMRLRDIGKIFGCSKGHIGGILISYLGKDKYKKIAKKHSEEGSEKWRQSGTDAAAKLPPTEKQLEVRRENGRKVGKIPQFGENNSMYGKHHSDATKRKITDSLLENAKENGFISSWEDKLFEKHLKKVYFLFKIERQYRIHGVNHPFDFGIPELMFLFEVDGDHWHDNPEAKKKDAEIDRIAKSKGWSVIRFNDARLKKLNII